MRNTSAITAILIALASIALTGCSSTPSTTNQSESTNALNVLHYADINWTPLNPARGDNSPRAGTLWGDRSADVATGFLVQFKEGFSSPPHIHNVTYRGIVISGLVHNDDPDAAKMWMPAGSYWTQPKGEAHITAAKDSVNMAYIEIDAGPYLVRPTDQAFDNGERPINIDASNIVWLDATNGAQIAYLWGSQSEGQPLGTLIKLPQHFTGSINTSSPHSRAVVIQGQLDIQPTDQSEYISLEVGSAFESRSTITLPVSNSTDQECIFYIRSVGDLTVSNK